MDWKDILKEDNINKGLQWFMPKEKTKEEQRAGYTIKDTPQCPVCGSSIRAKADGSGYECSKDPSHYSKNTKQIYEEAGNK